MRTRRSGSRDLACRREPGGDRAGVFGWGRHASVRHLGLPDEAAVPEEAADDARSGESGERLLHPGRRLRLLGGSQHFEARQDEGVRIRHARSRRLLQLLAPGLGIVACAAGVALQVEPYDDLLLAVLGVDLRQATNPEILVRVGAIGDARA